MKMDRLTDSGKVGVAAISPDGRYVAYSVQEPQHSLWVRQVSPESTVQVLPPSQGPIRGLTFSPDSSYLYFVRNGNGYVIPALGGTRTPRLIIENTFGGIGVSPDGMKLAFVHGGNSPKSQLLVVNRDGTDEQVIAEHLLSSGIWFNTAGAPSWSPDGRLIAMPVASKGFEGEYCLNIYPSGGGAPKVIPLTGTVSRSLWLPDGSGIILAISASFNGPTQLWLQPFPRGDLQRLTNDLDTYGSLSIRRDGKLLAAVQWQNSFTIFVTPASKPDQGAAIRTGKSDGIGLVWMSDGTLLSQNLESEFSSLTPDWKLRVSLFKDEGDVSPGGFSLCKDGHLMVQRKHIWRTEVTGHNPKQITEALQDAAPDCSPDAKSLIYVSRWKEKFRLMRVPASGGTPIVLSKEDRDVDGLRYSPNGRETADLERDDDKEMLVIRNAETGEVTRSFNMPKDLDTPWNSVGWILRWTPDGRTLTYARWKGPGSPVNLWSQSLSGGPPLQITNFPDQVVAYDWSPDGKHLALTRSAPSSDVVLISNFH